MRRTRFFSCILAVCVTALLPDELAAQGVGPPQVRGEPHSNLSEQEAHRIVAARRRVRSEFFDAASHAELAKAYHDSGASIMAFRLLRFAQTRYFPPAQFLRAFHEAFHGDVPERKLLTAEAALASARDDTESDPTDSEAWREYGRRLAAGGSSAEAKEALRRACDLASDDGASVAALGSVMAAAGDGTGARQLLEAFLADHPADADARVELADILRRESPAGAIAARGLMRLGLELSPESPKLHLGMAYLLSTAEHSEAASHHYRLAAELDPENPTILAWYARSLLVDKREKSRALDVYLKSWFLDPTARETSPIYERITSLVEDGAAEVLAAVQGERAALLLFDSWNPQVALGSWSLAFQQKGHSAVLVDVAFSHLAHDDEAVRFQAARYLGLRAPEAAKNRLGNLFDHEDVFVRGLAFYIGIARWGKEVRVDLERGLESDNDYLRYESYSALLQVGKAWGRRLFDKRFPAEPSERIRELIRPPEDR